MGLGSGPLILPCENPDRLRHEHFLLDLTDDSRLADMLAVDPMDTGDIETCIACGGVVAGALICKRCLSEGKSVFGAPDNITKPVDADVGFARIGPEDNWND